MRYVCLLLHKKHDLHVYCVWAEHRIRNVNLLISELNYTNNCIHFNVQISPADHMLWSWRIYFALFIDKLTEKIIRFWYINLVWQRRNWCNKNTKKKLVLWGRHTKAPLVECLLYDRCEFISDVHSYPSFIFISILWSIIG